MSRKADRDERILSALLTAPSKRKAAAACGISERQLYDRLTDPVFRAEYDKRRGALLSNACAALQGTLTAAIEEMDYIAHSAEASPQTRLNACEAILRGTCRLTELTEITARIEHLEQIAAEMDGDA